MASGKSSLFAQVSRIHSPPKDASSSLCVPVEVYMLDFASNLLRSVRVVPS